MVPGIERLNGAGVYYGAAMAEAIECRGETVYLVGGANSAGQAAVHFAGYAGQVVMLVRGSSLKNTMSKYLIDRIQQTPNISVQYNSEIVEVHGTEHLEAITVHCANTGKTEKIQTNYLFIFIGARPHAGCVEGIVECDERGFILSRSRFDSRWSTSKRMAIRSRSKFVGNQHTRNFRCWRCASRICETCCIRSW